MTIARLRRPLLLCLLAAAFASPCSAFAGAVAVHARAATPAGAKIDQLATAFYQARAQFDPLMITANGDSRYDSELGLAIAPKVRAAHFARYRQLRRQLAALARAPA
jgi:hypothetical protein